MTELEWRRRAACRGVDPELFFTAGESGRPTRATLDRLATAKTVCRGCPVVDECREWAIDVGDDHGILGGTTPAERSAIRNQRDQAALTDGPTCANEKCKARLPQRRFRPVTYCTERCRKAVVRGRQRELVAA